MAATEKSGDTVHYTIEDRDRLGRLESDVTTLQMGFSDLRDEVRSGRNETKEGFRELSRAISSQASKVEQGGKTNWQVVLTGLGTVITLSIAAASVTVMYVNNVVRPHELAIDYLKEEVSLEKKKSDEILTRVSSMIDSEIEKFDDISEERSKTVERRLEANEDRIGKNESMLSDRTDFIGEMLQRTSRLEVQVEHTQENAAN